MRRAILLGLMVAGCQNDVEPEGAFGYANIDDDNRDGRRDWSSPDASDDDFTPLALKARNRAKALKLSLDDASSVRVWLNGSVILSQDITSTEVPYAKEALQLQIEFGDYNLNRTLTVVELSGSGKAIGDPRPIPLRSGPLLVNHHLQPSVSVQSVDIPGYTDPLVNAYRDAMGSRYLGAAGEDYGFDVWMQDEIEFVTTYGRDGFTGAVLDSIRDRGLARFAEDELVGPGMGKIVRGTPSDATSQDYFGNLEATPPIEGYPFGRIYYGDFFGRGIDPQLADFLERNSSQEPFILDVSWLCVGHVDEYVAFVPDVTAPKGFRVALADTTLAWKLLEAMPANTALPQYTSEYGIRNVGQLVNSAQLRTLNDEIQSLHLDTAKERLIEELGLIEEDFIYIPDLFEAVATCGGLQAALIPGMVNLVVDNPRGGPSRIFLADPFVRATPNNPSNDPFIAEVRRVMPAQHELVFVDDWEAYHIALGEIHCGTNVSREPAEHAWWPLSKKETKALEKEEK